MRVQTFVSEEFTGYDGRYEHGFVDLQLCLLQVVQELGDDGTQRVDAHDGEEEVKGLREELEGLGLGSWSDQFILRTLDPHEDTGGLEEVLQSLQELLRSLALRCPVCERERVRERV